MMIVKFFTRLFCNHEDIWFDYPDTPEERELWHRWWRNVRYGWWSVNCCKKCGKVWITRVYSGHP